MLLRLTVLPWAREFWLAAPKTRLGLTTKAAQTLPSLSYRRETLYTLYKPTSIIRRIVFFSFTHNTTRTIPSGVLLNVRAANFIFSYTALV